MPSIEELRARGVRGVRLQYPDLHGICRGRLLPLDELETAAEDGAPFVEAVMTTDLRHNIVAGFDRGFRDIVAYADLGTLAVLPWDEGTAICLCDLQDAHGDVSPLDSRAVLRRAIEGYGELGLHPVLGPELEFYLCERDEGSSFGWKRYEDVPSRVYTNDPFGDPRGALPELLHACHALGLGAFAGNHEYGRGQYEINLKHGDAFEAIDRCFRFKAAVKELAYARYGLLATFIGKAWNDDEGSGLHLHASLRREDGSNAFADPESEFGLAPVCRAFVAGLLEHAAGIMAFTNPTTNAYRRMVPDALVPTRCNWGHDNRFVLARVPHERGKACRVELRVGDGAASPHLAAAAMLIAGLDGIRRELSPPEPLSGLIYEEADETQLGEPLPSTLGAALDALEADELLVEGMGAELVATHVANKRFELERSNRAVTDWEFTEYALHL